MTDFKIKKFDANTETVIAAAPGALDALWLGERFRAGRLNQLIHIAVDDRALAGMAAALRFLVPGIELLLYPAWDCLPYDRVGPNGMISARRIDTLWRLARRLRDPEAGPAAPFAVLTTVNAALQKVAAPDSFARAAFGITRGGPLDLDSFRAAADRFGYSRSETVMEPGEFAVRGGIVDVFPAGADAPVRLDLFGDTVERIDAFDPINQMTLAGQEIDEVTLKPVSEVLLTKPCIDRFRTGYRALFGAAQDGDLLYESVSEGRRMAGMEHWLPLFQEEMATLFDYLPATPVSFAAGTSEAVVSRQEQIADYYAARKELEGSAGTAGGDVYNPLPPDALYLMAGAWEEAIGGRGALRFDAFARPADGGKVIDAGGRLISSLAAQARATQENPFDLAAGLARARRDTGARVVFACSSPGSLSRIRRLLIEHGVRDLALCADWSELEALAPAVPAIIELDLEQGVTAPGLTVITEPDILGRKLARPRRRDRAKEAFAAELSALEAGDLVVHADHGIGRYEGLETLELPGEGGARTAAHDCLRLIYAGGDKLYVPVENIDVLSRYGEDHGTVALDRLGGAAWQSRKSRLKNRIREMAAELLKIAAARTLAPAKPMSPGGREFEEFCARFPYSETEDQQNAIADTLADMARDRPMDRLICGDVGFGKTEVALRAAFAAVISGTQVAVVVPTTLLARQHFEVFSTRFEGTGAEVAQLSRLVTPADAARVKERIKDGSVDIVIGTHALLAKSIDFANLGLLVVDEEQHFGVAHKERLKQLRADIHVLTLTATPIPRTLQLALTGVKDMSIIASPPLDRLAVRTFVLPYDPLVTREAIKREIHRGGQCFYVCPRISDIATVTAQIAEIMPDARVRAVHGQMQASEIESTMAAFLEGAFDIMISTNIIESGLDLPNVNTIIIHRADMFGLGQLYQLRGRVGRSRVRAYAYLTLPPRRVPTAAALKRLEVMQTLDSLGAGFTLASHDLDLRGAGNLLGEEQSGHIREVGIELYQHMLEETVAELRGAAPAETEWSPQVNLDIPVLIPETYVADLGLRLGLYRRLAGLTDGDAIEAFAAELIDRFGPLPMEVDNLLAVLTLKQSCRAAGVEKADAGRRGCLLTFRGENFANPEGLIAVLAAQAGTMRLRPDHTLVIKADWPTPADQIRGLGRELDALARIAGREGAGVPQETA
ncbi:MAG: transcription-repair coupling factor [Alphaproteobacteria bacterium]|nr:transcription-repair coupling factor [Alphaproteobacteria bacterium]